MRQSFSTSYVHASKRKLLEFQPMETHLRCKSFSYYVMFKPEYHTYPRPARSFMAAFSWPAGNRGQEQRAGYAEAHPALALRTACIPRSALITTGRRLVNAGAGSLSLGAGGRSRYYRELPPPADGPTSRVSFCRESSDYFQLCCQQFPPEKDQGRLPSFPNTRRLFSG
jgi:hypothetical protein